MKYSNKTLAIILLTSLAVTGCGKPQTAQEQREESVSQTYVLNAEERAQAQTNAKGYFEKEWVVADNVRGAFNECKPSDSNKNGLVSCYGSIPNPGGGYKEQKRFCGYDKKIVGCTPDDSI